MKPRILIVEDERAIQLALESLLRKAGYEIALAGSGSDAIAAFQSQPADLVITDLRLPGQDGIAVLKAARSQDPLAKVIVVTAQGDEDFAMKACNEGAFRYLKKPYKNQELILNARQALEMHAKLRVAQSDRFAQRTAAKAVGRACDRLALAFRTHMRVHELEEAPRLRRQLIE